MLRKMKNKKEYKVIVRAIDSPRIYSIEIFGGPGTDYFQWQLAKKVDYWDGPGFDFDRANTLTVCCNIFTDTNLFYIHFLDFMSALDRWDGKKGSLSVLFATEIEKIKKL